MDSVVSDLGEVLHRAGVPIIVWGEIALQQYGIPTMIFVSVSRIPACYLLF